MKEAQIQTEIGRYLKLNQIKETMVVELKFVNLDKQKNFRFSQLQDHQQQFMIHDFPQTFYYKISDSPIFSGMKSRFTASKPFDFMNLWEPTPYIAVAFYRPRTTKIVYFIHPSKFKTPKSEGNLNLKQPTYDQSTVASMATFYIDLRFRETNHPSHIPNNPKTIKSNILPTHKILHPRTKPLDRLQRYSLAFKNPSKTIPIPKVR